MFGTPGINEFGFQTSTIGVVAIDISYGTSKPSNKDGDLKYLRMGNITDDGHLDFNDMKFIHLEGNEYEKAVVREGDFLFNRTNSIDHVGRCCTYHSSEEAIIAGYIIRVRLNESVIKADYLSSFLNTKPMKKWLRNIARGSVHQANINATEMASIPIFLPPLEKQEAFISLLRQVDKLKFNAHERIKLYQELLNKKMDEYFG